MAKRPIEPLVNGRVRLRLLEEADLPLTLGWRNRDENRRWFFSTAEISPDQHRGWFEKYRERDDDFVFVIEEIDVFKRPVGQLSLYDIDWTTGRAEFGRLLMGDPEARGLGLAQLATALLVDEALERWGLREISCGMPLDQRARDRGVRGLRLSSAGASRRRDPDGSAARRAEGMTAANERPLRVLLVTGAYAPEISSGGLQSQMVAQALAGRVAFKVLTTAVDTTLPRRSVVNGVPVSRIVVDADNPRSKLSAAGPMLAETTALMRDTDVVHLHGYSQKNVPVTAVAKSFGVPIVLSLHTAGFDEPEVIRQHGPLARWALKAASLYLTVSQSLSDACQAAGLPADKIRHVPNGVNLERFQPPSIEERAAIRHSLGLPIDRPIVLFVGFFSREKQPHVLFEAWLRLQRRDVAGDARLRRRDAFAVFRSR